MSLVTQISLDTKALILINEYLRVRRDFGTLASFAASLSADPNELSDLINQVGELLAAAGYQEGDVTYLVQGLRQALAVRSTVRRDTPPNPQIPTIPQGAVPTRPPAGTPGAQPFAPNLQDTDRSPPITPQPPGHTPVPRGRVSSAATISPGRHAIARNASPFQMAQAKGRGGTMIARRAPPPDAAPQTPPQPGPRTPRPDAPAPPSLDVTRIQRASATPVAGPQSQPRILIADDDPRARILFRTKLEEYGFEVDDAGDGAEAWQKIKLQDVQGIILDIKLPGVTGIEILERMNRKKIATPVVVVTSFGHVRDEMAVQQHPNLKYFVKPIEPAQILDALLALGCAKT